jgi:hypothetical protein
MMKKTRRMRDLAAHLRHIANMLETADAGELPLGASISVHIAPDYSAPSDQITMALIDEVAKVTGQPAAFDNDNASGAYTWYRTTTPAADQAWTLTASGHVRRPVNDLEAENARLRDELAKLQAAEQVAHA